MHSICPLHAGSDHPRDLGRIAASRLARRARARAWDRDRPLRAAHEDDQYAVRRQMRDAEREIEIATRRIWEIGQDIVRLTPTTGDAFTMMTLGEKHTERKEAGRALMKEILTRLQLQ